MQPGLDTRLAMANDSLELPQALSVASAWLLATDEQVVGHMRDKVAKAAKLSWDMHASAGLPINLLLKNKEKDGANYHQ
ncbi:hypothetical protein [Rhizobium sp. LEGMi135b]